MPHHPHISKPELSTVDALNAYFTETNFDYNFGCAINFYTNRKQIYESIYSNDFMPNIWLYEKYYFDYFRTNFCSLFNTPNQYYGTLYYYWHAFKQRYQYALYPPIISFAEVFHEGEFIARHFIRNNEIIATVSFEEDRKLCPYIRLPLVAKSPILDWRCVMMVSFWKKKPYKSDYDFLNYYKTK